MQDTPRSMIRSARSFFSGTIVSRISGMARDIAMASTFGTEPTLAAFFISFRLAHLLRRLLGEGALQSAFIPHFEKLKSEKQASAFFIDLYGSIALLLLLLIGVAMGGIALLLQFGDLSSSNHEIALFSLVMLPSALFICLFGLNASLLQCEKYYFLPSFAPVAFNVIWMSALPFLKGRELKSAMIGLSMAICLACFFQWLSTLPKSLSIVKRLHGGAFGWRQCRPFSSAVRALFLPLVLGIAGVAATQINSALDLLFARYADPAGPAYLWFAIRLAQLPLALFGIALSSALLPALSRAIEKSHHSRYVELMHAAIKQTTTLMLPLTVILMILSQSGIRLLYGWGDFNATSITETSYCLIGYGLGLIPQALVLLVAPAFYAQKNFRLPAQATLFSVALNALLNFVMVFGLHWGAFSIAVATSLSAWGNFIFLALLLDRLKVAIQGQTLAGVLWQAAKQGLQFSAPGTLLAAAIALAIDAHISFTSRLIHFATLAAPFGLLFGMAAFNFAYREKRIKSL